MESLLARARAALILAATVLSAAIALADPFPPTLSNGAAHFPAVAWPSEPANPLLCGTSCGDWLPYSRFQNGVADPRTQDPSNGGTAPQNYVNISSSCVDKSFPSVYYSLKQGAAMDGSQDVIMFRWRVEQVANTYATGPSAGGYSASDPWSSALWSVLFDVDGDGYVDLAAHLDGSSGSPSASVDRIAGIWSKRPTQSLDYLGNPTDVKLLAHNPTGFVDTVSGRMLNFSVTNGLGQPQPTWPNGSAETVWDYGTTRAKKVSSSPCNEYFIDYQIPVRMLDATSLGGPKIGRSTPISMVFCTANSLNNPFQKDCAINSRWVGAAAQPAPFGDYVSFNQQAAYSQPIVSSVTATPPNSCPGSYTLTANVQDTLAVVGGVVVPSVKAVKFFYFHDADGNGLADDGGDWTFAADASLKTGSLNTWTASWSGASLPKGSYLIGVQALDDNTKVDDGAVPSGVDNRTFSYLPGDAQNRIHVGGVSFAAVASHSPPIAPSSSESWWGNPSVTGNQVALVGLALNTCGTAPTLSKAASAGNVAVGGTVDYTLTIANTQGTPLSVSQIQDALPAGFTHVSTTGGTLAPTTGPGAGASGALTWDFTPTAVLAAGATGTLTFRAQAPAISGNYNNTATATTSFGSLSSPPAPVAVDGVRLSLTKTPSAYQAPPDGTTPVTYTLRYANDSAVGVSSASISDALPAGLTYVSCSGGTACGMAGGTVSWTLGTLAGGASGTVQVTATVNPSYANTSLSNTATLQATDPAGGLATQTATATIAVAQQAPTNAAFTLAKSASVPRVAPGGAVTWTIAYANYGGAPAAGVVVSDTLPAGFTFVSCTGGCSQASGTVTWAVGGVAAGASGSVTVTATSANPFTDANPASNTASVNWTGNGGGAVTATAQVGVTGQSCSIYYFRQNTLDVGGGQGQRQIATQSTSAPAGAGSTKLVAVPASSGGFVTALELYTDPASASSVDFNGAITSYIYVDRANGPGLVVRTEVFDFDTVTGTLTAIGTASSITMNGSTKGLVRDNTNTPPSFNATGTLQKGHRLLFRYSVQSANTQTYNVYFQYDGNAVPNPISGGTTNAQSNGQFCVTPPANLTLAKTVNASTVPGGVQTAIQYTLAFSNTGQTKATGTTIVDTLPAGVSFVGATLNGGAIAPAQAGQQLTFTGVRSSTDAVAGEVSGGASGVLLIDALVDASATGSLTNNAQVSSVQTSPTASSATTFVSGGGGGGTPDLAISLSADATAAVPGQTVIYTVTVVNTGTAAAGNVAVGTALPVQSYYTYGSCSGGCGHAAGTLSWSIPSLAVGASAAYTFTMVAGTAGLPAGATVLADQASASATGIGPFNSNVVNVTLNGNPILALTKGAVSPATPAPGDTITYNLVVSNTGNSTATGVAVSDPIPSRTSFSGGVTASMGTGAFDPVGNRVVFQVGNLGPGASATLSFTVKVGALPVGSTPILNTASASAANAPQRTASASVTAAASATLTLSKQAPVQIAFPAATLTQAVTAGTELRVADSSQVAVGQYIGVGGSVALVTGVSPTTISLASPVTAASGSPVVAAIAYTLTYQNTGTATAATVQLTDTLPAGLAFVAASDGGTAAAGTVTWNLPPLEPGAGGSVLLQALPTAAGTLTNNASITCATCAPANASAVTSAGGLVVGKRTTTPTLSPGGTATYVIEVRNTSASAIAPVTVADVLAPGFSYAATVAVLNDGVPVSPASAPTAGDSVLSWGNFSLQPGKSLTVEFTAQVSASAGAAAYQNEAGATPANRTVAYDFLGSTAEDVTVLAAGTGLIGGVVFHDVDNDGVFNAAVDTPLAGALVRVFDAANVLRYEASTDAAGRFTQVVAAGAWTVEAVAASLPAGLHLGATFSNPWPVNVSSGGAVYRNTGFTNAAALPDLAIAKTHAGNFFQGQAGAAYSLVVSNVGTGPTSALVTVADTLPAGLTATSMAGTGWTCNLGSLSCTRGDALPAGQAYPAIALTVSVAANAAAQVTNNATVGGGGETNAANNTAADVTTIAASAPDLAIAKSHAGNFSRGQTGAGYVIAVSNAGSAPSSGVVTVVDTLPAGLTATAISGTGWSCTLASLTCTRGDALAAGQSYPPIAITVDVSANAAALVTNTASVSGGGDANPANNASNDPTAVDAPSSIAPVPALGKPGLLLLGALMLAAAAHAAARGRGPRL